MLRSVIIEDEPMSRQVLKSLLSIYCPDVMVCAEADGVQSGKEAIEEHHPDLVFLDIEMPDGSGFRLLNSFQEADFEVIFTTAYEQFAIKAIRHAALDYLMKPIDPDELQAAVEKVRQRKEKKGMAKHYEDLINGLDSNNLQPRKITLSTSDKIHVVDVDNIVRCESDNYYTVLYFADGGSLMVSKTLKEVEGLLEGYEFVRAHKSHLVNVNCIRNFLKDDMMILMSDGTKIPVSRRRKEAILEIINNI